MRSPDLTAVCHDLAAWSGPLIADRVSEYYAVCFHGDQRRVRPMTHLHCRLWRNLLLQESDSARDMRRELVRMSRLAGLDSRTLDHIDLLVVDELTEVIAARFHRSPALERDYSKTLIRAASSLTQARIAS